MELEAVSSITRLKKVYKVFNDPELLKWHLTVMQNNPDWQWYNCALIAMDDNLKANSISLVLPRDKWINVYDGEKTTLPLEGDGLSLLYPVFDPVHDIFTWTTKKAYSILDFGIKNTANEIGYGMPLKEILKRLGFYTLMDKKDRNELNALVNTYLESKAVYRKADAVTQIFLQTAFFMTWGKLLKMDVKTPELKLEYSSLYGWDEYRILHQIITEFPTFIIEWTKKQGLKPVEDKPVPHVRGSLSQKTLSYLYGGSQ